MAQSELSAVTMNRSRIPKASLSLSVVSNCALVKKFAWLARSDGIACTKRNIAISTMAITIEEPAAATTNLKSRSPRAAARSRAISAGVVPVTSGDAVGGPCAMLNPDHLMLLTELDNLDLNEPGMGIYPLSAKPFWPGPMVACRNAFTAVPTWLSGYFEQTISYVASTIG